MRGLLCGALALVLLAGADAQAGATRSYVTGNFLLELDGKSAVLDSFEEQHGVLAASVELGELHVTVYVLDNSAEPDVSLTPIRGAHFDDQGQFLGEVIGMHVEVRGWDPKQKKGRLGLDIHGDLEGKYESAAGVDLDAELDLTEPFKIEGKTLRMPATALRAKKTRQLIGLHVELQPTGSESSQLVLLGDLSGDAEEDDNDQGDDDKN